MKCPFCGFAESKVIDSRPAEEAQPSPVRPLVVPCVPETLYDL